jgi:hypothetical protein
MRILLTIVLLVLTEATSMAQTYAAEAVLEPVSKDGFYNISLIPGMSRFINPEFSNIRIMDRQGREVPYIVGVDETKNTGSEFMEYAIEQKVYFKDSCTVVVLANRSQSAITNISLVIKNAAVVKQATLAGSDDKKTWYALKDIFQLGYINNPDGIAEVEIVDFPKSNYPYYRLVIDDRNSAPLNILKTGYYTSTVAAGVKYINVPSPHLNQKNDTAKKRSYVTVSFDTLYFIDKVRWNISGLPYYLRQATLYTERERLTKKGKKEKFLEYIGDLQLNSRQENVQFIRTVKTDNLLLEIANDDNPPLEIRGVECFQIGRHLTSWLSGHTEYWLKFGTDELNAPVYDLEFFKDSIPSDPGFVKAGVVSRIKLGSASTQQSFFSTRAYIWAAIIVVIIFLGFMSLKMIRETSASQKKV